MRVAGFGFRSGATVQSLRSALSMTGVGPDRLATAAGKADDPAFRAFAGALGLPVTIVSPADLVQVQTATQSDRVMARFGVGSVAEAAALAAAGRRARLVVPRVVSEDGRATAAIAEGEGA